MADSPITIADMVYNSLDVNDVEARDIRNMAPWYMSMPMEVSSNGDVHKYTKVTAAPVVGFRQPNTGRDISKTGRELVTVNLSILDFSTATDKAVADADIRGAGYTISKEIREHVAAALFKAESQIINGQVATAGGDAAGHTGFADAIATLNDGTTGNVCMQPGTPGTTADSQTSVWFVREGEMDMMAVMHGDGLQMGDTQVTPWIDHGNSNSYTAYYTPGVSWCGLQIGSIWSVARLCNVETALTDADLSKVIAAFPAARRPTRILMTPKSQGLLQDSRTATNTTGAPAPFPESAFGIPITTVDSITHTEAILT